MTMIAMTMTAMDDIWHIKNAPLWLAWAFLSGSLMGLVDQSPDGVLSVSLAVAPERSLFAFHRVVAGCSPEEEIRIEEARFSVDHSTHILRYLP